MAESKVEKKGFSPPKPPVKPDKNSGAGYSPPKPPAKPKK
jgi:hypothetical protein